LRLLVKGDERSFGLLVRPAAGQALCAGRLTIRDRNDVCGMMLFGLIDAFAVHFARRVAPMSALAAIASA
jgi:hypothetical protein